MNRREAGFTLIEVVVVIAVIAILAAILAPSIIKHVDDAKISRAKAETKVIASAITSFYKDLGQWPVGTDPANPVQVLYTYEGNDPTPRSGSAQYTRWINLTPRAVLRDHLIRNRDSSGYIYPRTGTYAWKGPYATSFSADPWGNRYLINIGRINVTGAVVWVLSAGPNGLIETPFNQADTGTAPATTGGDDIGFRLK